MAARNRARTTTSNTDNTQKLTVPGILPAELIELEELIPDIRKSLAVVALIIVIIAQIRVASAKIKPSEFSRLESVNHYIKTGSAKSPEILSVAAGYALRRTMAAYAGDGGTDTKIKSDYEDLTTNLEGPSSSKENPRAIMANPERLRKYRRGLMLKATGSIQSSVLHYPRRIHPNVELIDGTSFLQSLPFATQDLTLDTVVTRVKELCDTQDRSFVDGIKVSALGTNTTALETLLGVTRIVGTKNLAELKLPTNIDTLPAWKRAAVIQAKNLYGGE